MKKKWESENIENKNIEIKKLTEENEQLKNDTDNYLAQEEKELIELQKVFKAKSDALSLKEAKIRSLERINQKSKKEIETQQTEIKRLKSENEQLKNSMNMNENEYNELQKVCEKQTTNCQLLEASIK